MWGTLETGEDAAGVESVDCDVDFAVEIEFFLDTTYCADKCCLSSIILNSHGTVHCAATTISPLITRKLPRANVDDTSFMSRTHLRDDFVH